VELAQEDSPIVSTLHRVLAISRGAQSLSVSEGEERGGVVLVVSIGKSLANLPTLQRRYLLGVRNSCDPRSTGARGVAIAPQSHSVVHTVFPRPIYMVTKR
jgi:hypothetical protein